MNGLPLSLGAVAALMVAARVAHRGSRSKESALVLAREATQRYIRWANKSGRGTIYCLHIALVVGRFLMAHGVDARLVYGWAIGSDEDPDEPQTDDFHVWLEVEGETFDPKEIALLAHGIHYVEREPFPEDPDMESQTNPNLVQTPLPDLDTALRYVMEQKR